MAKVLIFFYYFFYNLKQNEKGSINCQSKNKKEEAGTLMGLSIIVGLGLGGFVSILLGKIFIK